MAYILKRLSQFICRSIVGGGILIFNTATKAQEITIPQPWVLKSDGVTPDATVLNDGGPIIKNKQWAIALGKALFWDQQTGSDGNACASCHFNAGADTRLTNQLSPGFKDFSYGPSGDGRFGSTRSDTHAVAQGTLPSGAKADSNYTLKAADLPLHQLSDETDRNSPIVTTTNDRVSSQGAFSAFFDFARPKGQPDKCSKPDPTIFHAGSRAARQVEPRNTPTVINAAFFKRNFWDGRANNLFNGVGVFGMRDIYGDPTLRLLRFDANSNPYSSYLMLEDASLASQAVGPPLSALESSCSGQKFPDFAHSLVNARPLKNQAIDSTDSVLGTVGVLGASGIHPSGFGLNNQHTYAELIRNAFQPGWWSGTGTYIINSSSQWLRDQSGYTQMEANFSMFWGISIMLYEQTLVSLNSEFDTNQAAGSLTMTPSFVPNAGKCKGSVDLDPLLLRGCTIFSRNNPGPASRDPSDGIRGGSCFVCHNAAGGGVGRKTQPLLAENTTSTPNEQFQFNLFLTVTDVNGVRDLRDAGFATIGVKPALQDLVSGDVDRYGIPLSYGRQYWNYLDAGATSAALRNYVFDPPLQRLILGTTLNVPGITPPPPPPAPPARSVSNAPNTFRKLEVDGSAKAPILRNVALTPPYFNWGGYPSLRQVLKTYNRGLNRRDITSATKALENAAEPNALWGNNCASGDNSGTGPDGNSPFPLGAGSAAPFDCNTNTTGVIQPLILADCDAPLGSAPRNRCAALGYTTANDDLAALERFLKSLTDIRVQCSAAPFDHPSLLVNDGNVPGTGNTRAADITHVLPAVGAHGYAHASGYCVPNAGDLFAPGMQATSGGALAPAIP